jgi:PAS domain S-box-containing protein
VENDCRNSPALHREQVEALGLRSSVAVPIHLRGRTLGVLRADDGSAVGRFQKSDIDFLSQAAKRLATALDNNRVFQNLRRSEEKHFRLVESSPYGMSIVSGRHIVYANRAFRELLGRNDESFRRRAYTDLVEVGDLRVLDSALEHVRTRKCVLHREITLLRTDGASRHCEVTLAPLEGSDDRSVLALFSQPSGKWIHPARRSPHLRFQPITALLGGIAGDFSTVFSGILGQTAYLKLLLKPDDSRMRSVQAIENSALRASEYIKQILSLYLNPQVDPVLVNPVELIESLVGPEGSIRGKRRYESSAEEGVNFIEAHCGLLHLSLTCLIGALEDLFPSEGVIRVRLRNREWNSSLGRQLQELIRAPHVEIRFEPTTGDLSPKDLAHLVRPQEGGPAPGRGFGLPISLGILRAHGGAIAMSRSATGRSSVVLLFPAAGTTLPNAEEITRPEAEAAEASQAPLDRTPQPLLASAAEVVVLTDEEPS